MKILIVDDDPDLRDTLADVLETAGHEPLVARDGREALAMLTPDAAIDVVLLDLMMPNMNGWEFREEQLARADIASIPVIVMTAAADLRKTPISATAILHKPVTLAHMLETIRALV